MKAALSLAFVIVAFAACDHDAPSDSTSATARAVRLSGASRQIFRDPAMSKATANQAAPASLEAAQFGVGGGSLDAVVVPDAATGQDPLQNIDGATTAPTMMIRTGQAFIE